MGVLCPSRGPLNVSPILFNRPSELSKTIGWTFRSTGTFEKIDHLVGAYYMYMYVCDPMGPNSYCLGPLGGCKPCIR